MLRVDVLKLGVVKTNTYVVGDDESCLIFDIGSNDFNDKKKILDIVNNRKILGIFYTHSHFDHILGNDFFSDVPQFMSEVDFDLIYEHQRLSSYVINILATKPKNIQFLESDMIFGDFKFKVIETPGHTKGGVCFLFDNFIITGDTLFKGTYGRLDVGGNYNEMKNSLLELSKLDENLIIYPGHGKSSVLKDEIDWMRNF